VEARGVIVLATVRPDDWNLPLFLHILGAMVLVGGLVLAVASLVAAWRGGEAATVRVGYRALLLAVLPGWLVMRLAAEWILSKEGLEDANLAWVDIGFALAEPGLLLIIVATVLAGLAARSGRAGTGVRVAAVLVSVLVVAYLVAVWAMTTKPT
jgi:phage shock protein PspC (stress-responsive transcriptional regulator)